MIHKLALWAAAALNIALDSDVWTTEKVLTAAQVDDVNLTVPLQRLVALMSSKETVQADAIRAVLDVLAIRDTVQTYIGNGDSYVEDGWFYRGT